MRGRFPLGWHGGCITWSHGNSYSQFMATSHRSRSSRIQRVLPQCDGSPAVEHPAKGKGRRSRRVCRGSPGRDGTARTGPLTALTVTMKPLIQAVPKWQSAGGVLLAGLRGDLRRYVYICKPSNNYGPWCLPKGRVEKGENIYQTALAEVREETGIVANIVPHSYLGEFEGKFSRTHYVCMTFGRLEGKPDFETEQVRVVTLKRAIRLFEAVGNYRDACVVHRARELLALGE